MALKKNQLYTHLWEAANALRGGMDASMYKDYVLTILFVKYVTDKYKDDPYNEDGFTIPEGGSFDDMVSLKGKSNIGEGINEIIAKIAEENKLEGLRVDFDDDSKLGSGKQKVERLTKLISIFENPELDFSQNRADGDDILGDVYEYFMKKFAAESGKSKGQFYTPAEVSRIMAQIIGVENATSSQQTAYDPTCGSGSLLLKVADEAPVRIPLYGQEIDLNVANLAKMNMILHSRAEAEIMQGNTLANPKFINNGNLKTFDFAVANPPFSQKNWTDGLDPENDPYNRFVDGIPPAKNGDYAFLLHFIRSLKPTGKGAIILPHGVLFRGNTEAQIRKNLIKKGYIKGIIGLPPNLFYGTNIPAVIIIIDKEEAKERKGIFIIDASKGYIKEGDKNRLRERDIHKIVSTFKNQAEEKGYSRFVLNEEIAKNDYNLNIPRYIETADEEEKQDLNAHLHGGFPKKDVDKIKVFSEFTQLKKQIFELKDKHYYITRIDIEELNDLFDKSDEFKAFKNKVLETFDNWAQANKPKLENLAANQQLRVKKFIREFSESLLSAFQNIRLLEPYAVFQILMNYWDEQMKDDVYWILENGWDVSPVYLQKSWESELLPKEIVIDHYFMDEKKNIERLEVMKEQLETEISELIEDNSAEDQVFYDTNGKVSKAEANKILNNVYWIIIQEDYKDDYLHYLEMQKQLQDDLNEIELIESQEKNILKKFRTKTGIISKSAIKKHLKNAQNDKNNDTEIKILKNWLDLTEDITSLKKEMKELETNLRKDIDQNLEAGVKDYTDLAVIKKYIELQDDLTEMKRIIKQHEKELDPKLLHKYKTMPEDEIKHLVIEQKWYDTLRQNITDLSNDVATETIAKIKELYERYSEPLPEIEKQVSELEKKVKGYIEILTKK